MLDAYCQRIGHEGARAPTLAVLDQVIARHLDAIPFENFDPLTGRVPDLNPAAIRAKLIGAKRGGYCFEQNALLREALGAMGFEAEGLIARVWWQRPPGTPPGPWSHMALRVRLDGADWLADAGFGGCVPPRALRLDSTAPQQTRFDTYRFRPTEEGRMLEARIGEDWAPVYEIRPEPARGADYAEANQRAATESFFRTELALARTTAEQRIGIRGPRLTRRGPQGVIEQRNLEPAELAEAIEALLGLDMAPDWHAVLVAPDPDALA